MESGRGRGVRVGLSVLRLAHSVFCACLLGDFSGEGNLELLVVLRIVAGVAIVLLRIDCGKGLFGDRTVNTSRLSICIIPEVVLRYL
jgi:hypothetical protein